MHGLVPLITVAVMRSTVNGLVSLITVSVMRVIPTRSDKQQLFSLLITCSLWFATSFLKEGWPPKNLERTKCQKAWNELKTKGDWLKWDRLVVLAVDHLTVKAWNEPKIKSKGK